MASIDPETGELVVRIAYDGAGRAGKTTNIVKLSEKLNREVFTPEQPGDRTVYFDWMKYKGGRFEGLPIRCEMVTVPGQELLKERRELLLQQADVVVEVFDVSETTVADLHARVTAIREAKGHALPRNVIVQLNKCDLVPKTPLPDLHAACKGFKPPVRCVEAIAAKGQSVQETFVFSVREALDRVRALRAQGLLPSAKDMTGDGLLAWLKKNEALMKGKAGAPKSGKGKAKKASASASSHAQPVNQSSGQSHLGPPAVPDTDVAPGRIWPPKVGRSILESIDTGQCQLEPAGDHGWYGALGQDWHMYSGADCVFETEQDGIQGLLRWARHCSSLEALLSSPRCIVLAPVHDHGKDNEQGPWRLWQLVSSKQSLRDEVSLLLDETDQEVVAHHLCSMAGKLLDMEANRQYCVNLPDCTLDSVGGNSNVVQYVGFLAAPPQENAKLSDVPMNNRVLLNREFASLMQDAWPDRSGLLAALGEISQSSFEPRAREIGSTLAQLLESHIKSAAS